MRRLVFVLLLSLTACPGSKEAPNDDQTSAPEAGPGAAELEMKAKSLLVEAQQLEDEAGTDPAKMQVNLRKAAELRAEATRLMVQSRTRGLAE